MKQEKTLSVIIPCYNEERNFQQGSLEKVYTFLKEKFLSQYEVIIVDDGSSDASISLIEDYLKDKKNWFLIKKEHQGKAAAVEEGVRRAVGRYVLFTDFDQATPINEAEKLLSFITQKGYDIVIGSREGKGSKREKEPFYRHLMGRVFNLLVQLLALPGIDDTQCGFKLFKTKQAKVLFPQLKVGHIQTKRAYTGAFDVELLYLARKRGLRIAEVPVVWTHYKTNRVDPIKDSLKMFADLVKIRVNDFTGKYDDFQKKR